MSKLQRLLNSGKTVFSKDDLRKILKSPSSQALDIYLYRAKKEHVFDNPSQGIYTLKKYNTYELACKLKKNSYISFETVLTKAGIVFQDYSHQVRLASDNSLKKNVEGIEYTYRKIKNSILLDPIGIEHKGTYAIATSERALCDTLYLNSRYAFDTLESISWRKAQEIAMIYPKRVIAQINQMAHATQ